MPLSSMKVLSRYHYDPLDRLMGVGLLEHTSTRRFYQDNYLATELDGQGQRSIIRHAAQPLAQQQSMAGTTETTLLATDRAHSLLHTLTGTHLRQMAYAAYGHHPAESGLSRFLGFNGECPDSITGHYLLGQGKRAYNPVLMRFNSPDNLSPFGEGGINSYAYCKGNPVNLCDPTGNMPVRKIGIARPWRHRTTSTPLDLSTTTGPLDLSIRSRNSAINNPMLSERLSKPSPDSTHLLASSASNQTPMAQPTSTLAPQNLNEMEKTLLPAAANSNQQQPIQGADNMPPIVALRSMVDRLEYKVPPFRSALKAPTQTAERVRKE